MNITDLHYSQSMADAERENMIHICNTQYSLVKISWLSYLIATSLLKFAHISSYKCQSLSDIESYLLYLTIMYKNWDIPINFPGNDKRNVNSNRNDILKHMSLTKCFTVTRKSTLFVTSCTVNYVQLHTAAIPDFITSMKSTAL